MKKRFRISDVTTDKKVYLFHPLNMQRFFRVFHDFYEHLSPV